MNLFVNDGIYYSLSAIKSAAVFDGAHIKIFSYFSGFFNQFAAIAITTNVLPVPGGP